MGAKKELLTGLWCVMKWILWGFDWPKSRFEGVEQWPPQVENSNPRKEKPSRYGISPKLFFFLGAGPLMFDQHNLWILINYIFIKLAINLRWDKLLLWYNLEIIYQGGYLFQEARILIGEPKYGIARLQPFGYLSLKWKRIPTWGIMPFLFVKHSLILGPMHVLLLAGADF